MRRINLKGIAGVVAIHGKRRHQHGAVDTDGVHRGHHLVAGNLRRAVENTGPGASRVVALVSVDLGIQCRHDLNPPRNLCRLRRYAAHSGGSRAALEAWAPTSSNAKRDFPLADQLGDKSDRRQPVPAPPQPCRSRVGVRRGGGTEEDRSKDTEMPDGYRRRCPAFASKSSNGRCRWS